MPCLVARMVFFPPLNTHAEPRFQVDGLWTRLKMRIAKHRKKGGMLPEVSLKVSRSPISPHAQGKKSAGCGARSAERGLALTRAPSGRCHGDRRLRSASAKPWAPRMTLRRWRGNTTQRTRDEPSVSERGLRAARKRRWKPGRGENAQARRRWPVRRLRGVGLSKCRGNCVFWEK